MDFRLRNGQQCVIRIDGRETAAVKIAVSNLVGDLNRTLGSSARILWIAGKESCDTEDAGEESGDTGKVSGNSGEDDGVESFAEILIGTLDVSEEVRESVDISGLCDAAGSLRKEAYLHRVSEGRLVIAGSDRRGTVYGIYELCEELGVSPWYFWADVPVRKRQEFMLPADYRKADYPSVEYRGIFINDEEELEAWVQNFMGEPTIGVKTYEKVFELLLRLKANYIWPAMHVNSFNVTPENGALADRMGIVVGTSHCDMLMRSNNREWKPWIRKKGYEDAVYDYSIEGQNRDILREYWKESVEQNQDFEVCYTLGMRGIHDSGFETKDLEGKTEEEIRDAKVKLLEKIIADQRKILKDTLGHDTMMTFIPYKEVLELYDNGLEIPEDMTLVWANDNYGYIRRYPSESEKGRKGGNGIYYHNSYWAPPGMSYVFLCSIPLAHTRNELQKAWNEGIRKLWVLNSGAMKPLEQEITFFLKLAWEIGKPGALTEDVEVFAEDWINRTFTGNMGRQVSGLLNDFSQLTNVRKVENMDYDAFSQTAYGDEAVVRIHRYEELFARGNELYEKLPETERDAFFQLVLMRIHAAYFTNLAYYYGDRSTLMYERGNMQAAAFYTEKSREAEDARRRLVHYYNHVMCGGKWKGILNPEGFPPPRAAMMPVCTPPLAIGGAPSMRIDIWNEAEEICFITPGEKWIEIGNLGAGEIEVSLHAPDWVRLSGERTVTRGEKRILVGVDDTSEDRSGELVVENLSDGSRQCIPVRTVKAEYAGVDCVPEEDGLVVLECESAAGMDLWNEGLKSRKSEREDLQNEGMTGRDSEYKNLQNKDLKCQNIPQEGLRNEGMTGRDGGSENLRNKSLKCQNIPQEGLWNEGMTGRDGGSENLRNKDLKCQNIPQEGLRNDGMAGRDWGSENLRNKNMRYAHLQNKEMKSRNLQSENPEAETPGSGDFRIIRRLGRMQGNLAEACVQREAADLETAEAVSEAKPLRYCFATHSKGEFLLEIHRFPSLNSVGRLRVGVSLDGGPIQVAESFSNDEWRGNWKKNVLNNVDRLYLKLSVPETGKHWLCVWAIDKYFAFSRMIIYTEPRKENNLAGIRGAQALPADWKMCEWCDLFYGEHKLLPRPIFYAARENNRDTLVITCKAVQEERYGRKVTPDWYLEQGKSVFEESGGAVRIDAAAALVQGSCAWTENGRGNKSVHGLWRHCGSESYGQSGLAMYIRTPELHWTPENAPSLNYRIYCEGGAYTLWMLCRFNMREESFFGIGIDGEIIPAEKLYGNGGLWRYEAEQIYCWVPAVQVSLEKGEHILRVYALASGLRYDRFYLTGGTELPPGDPDFEI